MKEKQNLSLTAPVSLVSAVISIILDRPSPSLCHEMCLVAAGKVGHSSDLHWSRRLGTLLSEKIRYNDAPSPELSQERQKALDDRRPQNVGFQWSGQFAENSRSGVCSFPDLRLALGKTAGKHGCSVPARTQRARIPNAWQNVSSCILAVRWTSGECCVHTTEESNHRNSPELSTWSGCRILRLERFANNCCLVAKQSSAQHWLNSRDKRMWLGWQFFVRFFLHGQRKGQGIRKFETSTQKESNSCSPPGTAPESHLALPVGHCPWHKWQRHQSGSHCAATPPQNLPWHTVRHSRSRVDTQQQLAYNSVVKSARS